MLRFTGLQFFKVCLLSFFDCQRKNNYNGDIPANITMQIVLSTFNTIWVIEGLIAITERGIVSPAYLV